jgi:hypothetical protein
MHPELKKHIAGDIARLGFTTLAADDAAGWVAHTVGLTELGHPEILISGLHGEYCHKVFWNAYEAVKAGHHFKAGQADDTLGALTCVFKTLSPAAIEEFCWQAQEFYAGTPKTPTFLQLVMPDKQGHLPWQPGYDASLMKYQRHLWVQLH